MTTKVQKWGNSLAVRLPKEAVESVGLRQGSAVSIIHGTDLITIKPVFKPKEKLVQMVRKITKKNRHALIDWGVLVGKEIW
ncbi:MAG: AbrB/MazE/SpoVT family DNA-binding domain-containing protein [Candidatus Taylorbacteria bacterium]|nr:AbrB/MazE/SpoVT family DNA-binding domain-containing protein [Candidatus Taylorbacteria bacterium]